MTVRPGQYWTRSIAATALGGAAGLTFAIANSAWAVLCGGVLTYVATATAGNRQVVVRILDPTSGTIIFQNTAAVITAGQTSRLSLAAGLPNQSFASPLTQIVGIPVECPLAIFATINVFDNLNVDVNDTVAAVFVAAM